MRSTIKIFKALSDPNRVKILKMLEVRPLCVCEIPEILNLATSTVSKHLSILRDAGLILDHKTGKWVHYSLNNNSGNLHVDQLLALMSSWLNEDDNVRTYPSQLEEITIHKACKI